MIRTAILSIETDFAFMVARVTVDVIPGEDPIRFYNGIDGPGYPGSPDEINAVLACEVTEIDFGDDYRTRADLGVCTDTVDTLARIEVESGIYDDELLGV